MVCGPLEAPETLFLEVHVIKIVVIIILRNYLLFFFYCVDIYTGDANAMAGQTAKVLTGITVVAINHTGRHFFIVIHVQERGKKALDGAVKIINFIQSQF